MLDRAVAAVKQDKARALEMFNEGEADKDRDLYVFCAYASDGIITAHATLKGGQLNDFSQALKSCTGLVKVRWERSLIRGLVLT